MGDVTALANPRIYGWMKMVCVRQVRHWRDGHTIVEDLVQDAYCAAVRYWSCYDPEKGALTTWLGWLLRCAIQLEKQRRGAKKRTSMISASELDDEEQDELDDGELAARVATPSRQDDIVYAKEIWRAHEALKLEQTRAGERRAKEFERAAVGTGLDEIAATSGVSKQMVTMDLAQYRKALCKRIGVAPLDLYYGRRRA